METCKTTLETLVAAALGTDANTLGNNSGASYTNRFVFCGKYSFEAYCTNDKDIWIQLCEVDGSESHVLIGHCLTINHNELLAPIYAQFLWADFESLLYKNDALSHIDKENFAINLLNCREDDMADRARHTVEQVFATATEYKKFDNGTFFMSSEYGPVYFNEDCFEYYIDIQSNLPKDIRKLVDFDLKSRADWLKDNKSLSRLSGLTKATEAKCKEIASKPVNKSSAEAYTECLHRFKDDAKSIIDVDGTVGLAEELYNWQATKGVSFDFQTLALLFTELGAYEAEFSDELLRDTEICEIIDIAYVSPTSYN